MRHLLILIAMLLMFTQAALAAVNINTASQSELETLPGIGPSKAAAIIEYRTSSGPFASIAQLDDVPGIGPATMSNITPLVTIGEGEDEPVAAAQTPSAPAVTSTPTGNSDRVNVNTASQSELETLPGIGPSKAAAIIEYRTSSGPFASCSDLQMVSGIGPATVSTLAAHCAVE